MMTSDDALKDKLVVLATFTTAPEAHALRVALEAEGIAARIGNE